MLNPEIVAQLQEIHIGGLTFYGYGFIMALSVAIPYLLFRKVNRDPKISDFISAELLACMIVGGIVIGRLVFVVSEIDYFILNPQDILKTWEGGITIFGVVPGAVLGFLIFKKISKTTLNTWKFLDALVPFTALAQSIGRWANFLNQELYGPPTDLPWGMYISPEHRLKGYEHFESFHPAFLYESILSFSLFIFLFFMMTRRLKWQTFPGRLTGLYVMMYGLVRLTVNRYRLDAVVPSGTIAFPDIMAVLFILVGIVLFTYAAKKRTVHKRG